MANKGGPPEPVDLKKAFLLLLRRNEKNGAGYYRAHARLVWRQMFGDHIGEQTRDLMVRNRRLYVYVTNAPLRNQLTMVRENIRQKMNAEFGEEYLEAVIIK